MPAPVSSSCPSCGAAVRSEDLRCPLCGTALDAPNAVTEPDARPEPDAPVAALAAGPAGGLQACPACGHLNPSGARFCNACGAALGAYTEPRSARAGTEAPAAGPDAAPGRPSSAPGRQALVVTGLGLAAVVALYLVSSLSSRTQVPPPVAPASAQPASAVTPAPPLPDSLRALVASFEDAGTAEGHFEAGRLYLTAAFEAPEGGAGWAREALASFERSLTFEENPDVRVALAEAARLGGDPAQPMRAVEELQRVLAEHPDHVGGTFVLADLRATIGRLDGAEELFEKVIRLTTPSDPVHLRAQQNLAAVREARRAQQGRTPPAATPAPPPG